MRIAHIAAGLMAATAIVGFSALTSAASAQSGEAVVKVVAPLEEVDKGDIVTLDVVVENVENLGGFQFTLIYDEDLLRFDPKPDDAPEDEPGPFRKGAFVADQSIQCNEPRTESEDGKSILYINCVTLSTGEGLEGSGTLGTIDLVTTGAGTIDIELGRLKLVALNETADTIPSTGQHATVTVTGSDDSGIEWMIWGPVIGVAVLLFAGAVAYGASRRASNRRSAPAA